MLDDIPYLRFLNRHNDSKKARRNNIYPETIYLFVLLLSYLSWNTSLDKAINIMIFLVWGLIVAVLLALVVTNLRTRLLPNGMVRNVAVLAVLYQLLITYSTTGGSVLWNALLGGIIVGLPLYILFQVSDGKWLGGGDVKLGFVVGIIVGTWGLALISLVLWVLAFLTVVMLIHLQEKSDGGKGAYSSAFVESGPIWFVVTVVCVLYGQKFLDLFS